MKSYAFRVVVEPAEDRWHAYCPALERQGAATWGNTEEEALRHIREVVEMVVGDLLASGETLPEEPATEVEIFSEPRVLVTI
jgi:predicted RNase H-like HicB family nuclease